jgi:hypothetical protein
MSTIARSAAALDVTATPVRPIAEWIRLALVGLIVAAGVALGISSAASHPNVDAGLPEMPIAGWGD